MLVWHEINKYNMNKDYKFQDGILPELSEEIIIQYPDTPPFIGCFKYGVSGGVYSYINMGHNKVSHKEICEGIKWARFHEDFPSTIKELSIAEIHEYLEYGYCGAKMMDDLESMTRITRAIAALNSDVEKEIFSEDFETI